MTRFAPMLPTNLEWASTYDLLANLNAALANQAEAGDDEEREFNEFLSNITTELLRRYDGGQEGESGKTTTD